MEPSIDKVSEAASSAENEKEEDESSSRSGKYQKVDLSDYYTKNETEMEM